MHPLSPDFQSNPGEVWSCQWLWACGEEHHPESWSAPWTEPPQPSLPDALRFPGIKLPHLDVSHFPSRELALPWADSMDQQGYVSPPGCPQAWSKEVGCDKKPFSEFSEQSLVVGVGLRLCYHEGWSGTGWERLRVKETKCCGRIRRP